MGKLGEIEELILVKLDAKFWDFPFRVTKMVVSSYDVNSNPLIIQYYNENTLRFTHYLTYDIDGNITKKEIKIPE